MSDTVKNLILEKLPDTPVIASAQLHQALIGCISASALAALREGRSGLVIGEDNRQTLLRMLDHPDAGNGTAARADIVSLIDSLCSFLDRYMADQPEGHLWIVLCCVYLSMIVREPLHPQRFTHWYPDGDTYRCPAREVSPDSVCLWCICKSEKAKHERQKRGNSAYEKYQREVQTMTGEND